VNPQTGSQTTLFLSATQAYYLQTVTFDFEGRRAFATSWYIADSYFLVFNIDTGALISQPQKLTAGEIPSLITWVPTSH